MTLIEELLALFEEVYDDGMQASLDPMNDCNSTAQESAQKALQKLRSEMRSNISTGDERQVADPRSKYIDVQVDLGFYDWLWGETR